MDVRTVVLEAHERAELERRVRSRNTSERERLRASVVLLAAEGRSNRAISRMIGMRHEHVGTWRRRFLAQGLAGLEDRFRPGRPPVYGPEVHAAICRAICELSGNAGLPWSLHGVAEALAGDVGISVSQVRRICLQLGLEPGRPLFFTQLRPTLASERSASAAG